MDVHVAPLDVLGQGFLAGVQFAAEGAGVLLLLEGGVAAVLLLVEGQVGLGGVALKTDVTLERLLSRVHPGVALILPCKVAQIFRIVFLFKLQKDICLRKQHKLDRCTLSRTVPPARSKVLSHLGHLRVFLLEVWMMTGARPSG